MVDPVTYTLIALGIRSRAEVLGKEIVFTLKLGSTLVSEKRSMAPPLESVFTTAPMAIVLLIKFATKKPPPLMDFKVMLRGSVFAMTEVPVPTEERVKSVGMLGAKI